MRTHDEVRTQVAVIGAGPAGLLLSHLLARHGVSSVLLERRSPGHVLSRVRAGILESSPVELLHEAGLGGRLAAEAMEHRGIHPQLPGERHPIDFVEHTGRSVWVYGQIEVTRDLMRAREAAGETGAMNAPAPPAASGAGRARVPGDGRAAVPAARRGPDGGPRGRARRGGRAAVRSPAQCRPARWGFLVSAPCAKPPASSAVRCGWFCFPRRSSTRRMSSMSRSARS